MDPSPTASCRLANPRARGADECDLVSSLGTVNPRSCGADRSLEATDSANQGQSPRRGADVERQATAGSKPLWANPRARGADRRCQRAAFTGRGQSPRAWRTSPVAADVSATLGQSPRTRGGQALPAGRVDWTGSIPAHAGRTSRQPGPTRLGRVNPRARGADALDGRSCRDQCHERPIPAHAGRTLRS